MQSYAVATTLSLNDRLTGGLTRVVDLLRVAQREVNALQRGLSRLGMSFRGGTFRVDTAGLRAAQDVASRRQREDLRAMEAGIARAQGNFVNRFAPVRSTGAAETAGGLSPEELRAAEQGLYGKRLSDARRFNEQMAQLDRALMREKLDSARETARLVERADRGMFQARLREALDRKKELAHTANPIGSIADLQFFGQMVAGAAQPSIEYQHQIALSRQMGYTPQQIDQARRAAAQVSRQVPQISEAMNLGTIRELMAVMGNTPKGFGEILQLLPSIAQMQAVMMAFGGNPAQAESAAYDMIKAADVQGAALNVSTMREYLNDASRIVGATGGKLQPRDILRTLIYSRTAGAQWSQEFLMRDLPALMLETKAGGSGQSGTIGPALMSAFAAVVTGRIPQPAIPVWQSLGLLVPGHETYSRGGILTKVLPGGVQGWQTFVQNPVAWIQQFLAPRLAGMSPEKQIETLGYMFSNRTAGFAIEQMLRKPYMFERFQSVFNTERGLGGAGALQQEDVLQAMAAFTSQWHNLEKEIFDAKPAIPILNALSTGIGSLAGVLEAHPQVGSRMETAGIGIGGAALSLLAFGAAVNGVKWAFGGLAAFGAGIVTAVGAVSKLGSKISALGGVFGMVSDAVMLVFRRLSPIIAFWETLFGGPLNKNEPDLLKDPKYRKAIGLPPIPAYTAAPAGAGGDNRTILSRFFDWLGIHTSFPSDKKLPSWGSWFSGLFFSTAHAAEMPGAMTSSPIAQQAGQAIARATGAAMTQVDYTTVGQAIANAVVKALGSIMSGGGGGGGSLFGGIGGAVSSGWNAIKGLFGGSSNATPGGKPSAALGMYYAYLRSKGLDPQHAAAMVANIWSESWGRPGIIGDHGSSIGLFQEHAGRALALARAVPDWRTNWKGQLDFALAEQMKRNPAWFLRSGTEWLTGDWEGGFEAPKSLADMGARINRAGILLNQFGKLPGAPPASAKTADDHAQAGQKHSASVDKLAEAVHLLHQTMKNFGSEGSPLWGEVHVDGQKLGTIVAHHMEKSVRSTASSGVARSGARPDFSFSPVLPPPM